MVEVVWLRMFGHFLTFCHNFLFGDSVKLYFHYFTLLSSSALMPYSDFYVLLVSSQDDLRSTPIRLFVAGAFEIHNVPSKGTS